MIEFFNILWRATLVVAVIVALTRLHGLRSFSKMSGFDFAITVSIGSVLTSAVTTLKTDAYIYVMALVSLFIIQLTISQLRVRSSRLHSMNDNTPLLLMEDGKMKPENMRAVGLTADDLHAKLREANAYNLDLVHAVVMEATGDVSVLHGPKDGLKISQEVMQDVRR
ncbi:DUF421 domain-containing protein [Sulfitobacter sp.]|uniref:DUF421 domain-containing protein n=1 Tax=Sulfitobacter sp. TaxID=1903071 RepID=UPI003002BE20